LKQMIRDVLIPTMDRFLYIDPLKQGLKQAKAVFPIDGRPAFLYIDPLKQGLKLSRIMSQYRFQLFVFIHRSIKTRIETQGA